MWRGLAPCIMLTGKESRFGFIAQLGVDGIRPFWPDIITLGGPKFPFIGR